jgi:PKD repeat protein
MNKLYKPLFSLFFISVLFFSFFKISHSQVSPEFWPKFTMTAKNITTQPGANGQDSILFWDVYILQTNYGQPGIQPFEFCCAQYNWYFNKNIFQNPSIGNIVLTNFGAQTDLPSGLRPPTFQVDSVTNWDLQTGRPNTGLLKTSGNLPNSNINFFIGNQFPGTKALRMKVTTNGRKFNNVPLHLTWRAGPTAPNSFLAYFAPNPPGPDSANPQYAQSLLDSAGVYFVEAGGITILPPVANFTANNTTITSGGNVNFTNTSSNNPTSFNWFFPGGTPYTTALENPSNIVYSTPGVYTVYLRVANSAGADSITKTNYITVNPPPCSPTWSNFLKISDAGNIKDSLKFGTSTTATINIDPCFGETLLPPILPPSGAFDIRLILQNPPAYDASKIDIRPDPANDIFWKVKFQPSDAGYPITFTWDRYAFPPSGLFFLKDEVTGTIVNVDMKAQNSYVLPSNLSGITSLKIEYQYNLVSNVNVKSGWNILSVPLIAADMKFTNLFPLATTLAYTFNGTGYVAFDSAKISKGYWLKFGRDTTYRIVGVSITPKNIPVISGWNMIGPFDENIPVASIISIPSGIVSTFYFQYNNGYIQVDTLKAGKGYWVKTSTAGILMKNIAENMIVENAKQSDNLNSFTKFIITDNNSNISNLFLGNTTQSSSNYDLPPVPPNGIFDVRFGSDKFVESYGQSIDVRLNSVAYPIKIKAENLNRHNFRIKDKINGSIVNILIEDETEIEINSGLDNLLLIDENLLPDSYELSQNYPNPFNPTTKIKYQLPVDGNVKIIIFDMLGKEVQTLVNGFEKAGSYELTFNGINLASGIYFYKMQSENFSDLKRMILIK